MLRCCWVILLLFALANVGLSTVSEAQVICTGNASPPPELPVYDQPPIPAPGYIWTPGYWGIGPIGYFWVPGTWVRPPSVGLLWTPGYWGWRDGIYVWNAGYWGPHIGFYGGVNYGFGYGGVGYEGGRWENGVFAYNRTVTNLGGAHITNVYEKTVVNNTNVTRVSFNGGPSGTDARPTPQEEVAAHEQHVAAIPEQVQHERTAGADKSLLASENHGRPAIAATAKPGVFTGPGVVAAREHGPATMPAATGGAPMLKGEPQPKPTGTPVKPVNTEAKLPANRPEPLNTEAKPLTAKPEPLNREAKPPATSVGRPERLNPQARVPYPETKLPSNKPQPPRGEPRPMATGPSKGANPPPHASVGANPHPTSPAKDKNKDRKPPG